MRVHATVECHTFAIDADLATHGKACFLSVSIYLFFSVAAHHEALVQDPMKPQQFLNSFVMTQKLFYISTPNSMVCADIV